MRHHVLLSIVNVEHDRQVPHYAGKREQERLVTGGPVPWSIVRATQFHDFAAMVASWTMRDGAATIAPLLVQPIAQEDVAAALAEVATAPPRGDLLDIAGPETQDLVDMARRTFAVRGQDDQAGADLARRLRHRHGRRGPAARRERLARRGHVRRLARRRRSRRALAAGDRLAGQGRDVGDAGQGHQDVQFLGEQLDGAAHAALAGGRQAVGGEAADDHR